MQYRAIVPPGSKPGGQQVLKVNAGGIQLNVRTPKGAQPGDTFVFYVSAEDLAAAAASSLSENPPAAAAANPSTTAAGPNINTSLPSSGDGSSHHTSSNISGSPQPSKRVKGGTANSTTTTTTTGASDHHPVDHDLLLAKPSRLLNPYTEFGMALCFGTLIGLSIVVGFLLGVLYVTEPLGPFGELPGQPPIMSSYYSTESPDRIQQSSFDFEL